MPPQPTKAAPKESKKSRADYLSTHTSPRPYRRDELRQIFADIKGDMAGSLDPEKFYDAAMFLGTHSPKLVSARNPTRGVLLTRSTGNRPAKLAASGNGALAKHMKVILRPIEIEGANKIASLAERAVYGCSDLQDLLTAFGQEFGSQAETALRNGIRDKTSSSPDVSIGRDNYPVFFIPGANGASLQVGPGGNIENHINMGQLRVRMLSRAKQDRLEGRPATYGEWSVTALSGKIQNVIVGAPSQRVRFASSVPSVLRDLEASIFRYMKGGPFPRMFDDDAAIVLINFAAQEHRLGQPGQHQPDKVKEKQARRAHVLIDRARDHINEIQAEVRRLHPGKEPADPPSITKVLSGLPIARTLKDYKNPPSGLDAKAIFAKLNGPRFRETLKKVEGAQK